MPIRVVCSGCSKTYNVKDDLAGKKMRCKDCSEVLTIPKPKAAAAKKKPQPAEEDEYAFDAEEDYEAPAAALPASTRRGSKLAGKTTSCSHCCPANGFCR